MNRFNSLFLALLASVFWSFHANAAEPAANHVTIVDGIVIPQRPVMEAVEDAIKFLKMADGGYVPGRIDGDLAGYFNSAFVNSDGTRSDRRLSYPARQHAYFIFTFLHYYAYSGEQEWLLRARDLADWNMTHSTPSTAFYPSIPYSTFSNGKPGGSKDVDSIEPDKIAFIGSAYIAVYEATGEKKYLAAAKHVADVLARHQNEDGSWPFRVVPEDGRVRQQFGGAPVFLVEFFENIIRHENKRTYRVAHDKALKLMLERNCEKKLWGTYHEDIKLKPENYLSAEPMSFTAAYLFKHGKEHPNYINYGRQIISLLEQRLVYTNGHPAAPAPAVSEQAGFDHVMPGHTARYCLALANLYTVAADQNLKRKTLSGINALTYMQSPAGLFRTFFYSAHLTPDQKAAKPDWYSQHLYTVCHLLELLPILPEVATSKNDHILGSSVFLRDVHYAPGTVSFETASDSRTVLKLSFPPNVVYLGKKKLKRVNETTSLNTWSFDSLTQLLTIFHKEGRIEVRD